MSKLFMLVETVIGLVISFYSIYITMPNHYNPFTKYGLNSLLGIEDIESSVLFVLAIIATFEQAIFA